MELPKELKNKIMFMWMEIHKQELHEEIKKRTSVVRGRISYLYYYNFPEQELFYIYYGLLEHSSPDMEIIRAMRYLIDNKYRLEHHIIQQYYRNFIKLGRRRNIELFFSYYKFVFLWKYSCPCVDLMMKNYT